MAVGSLQAPQFVERLVRPRLEVHVDPRHLCPGPAHAYDRRLALGVEPGPERHVVDLEQVGLLALVEVVQGDHVPPIEDELVALGDPERTIEIGMGEEDLAAGAVDGPLHDELALPCLAVHVSHARH